DVDADAADRGESHAVGGPFDPVAGLAGDVAPVEDELVVVAVRRDRQVKRRAGAVVGGGHVRGDRPAGRVAGADAVEIAVRTRRPVVAVRRDPGAGGGDLRPVDVVGGAIDGVTDGAGDRVPTQINSRAAAQRQGQAGRGRQGVVDGRCADD